VELRGEEVRRNMERNIEEEEIHAFEVDGPFVGGDASRFAVRFSFDSTFRSTGERKRYSKVSLYTVEDEKLVREEVYHEPLGSAISW
jgi:ketosteroid isomerase-like protein